MNVMTENAYVICKGLCNLTNVNKNKNILLTCLLKLVSAIFHYFLKTNVFLHFFEQSTLKRNLTYSCFFFPLFDEHLFSPGLPRATRLLETSWLEKITVCRIETILVMLTLVQMNKARREVNRTNYVQTKTNIVKGLQTSVIHLIPGSTCHWNAMPCQIEWDIF